MTSTDGLTRAAGPIPFPRGQDGGMPPAPPPARRPRGPRRRGPRIALVSVLVGVVMFGIVYGIAALLPASYEGRIGLLALPTESSRSTLLNQSGVSTSYGEVVNLAMPSIADLATSPTLLDAVAASVPGSPPADDLGSRVGVELLGGSGVARISVTADDPVLAGRLTEAVAQRVIRANLLAPAGTLRALDRQATVLQVTPDRTLGIGLGLIIGLAAAGATVLLLRPFRNRAGAGRWALDAVAGAGRGPATLLDGNDPELAERARVLVRAADRPVRVVGASPGVEGSVRALQSDLARDPAGGRDAVPSVLVVVDRAVPRREDVDGTLAALPAGAPVLAVVVV